MKSIIVLIIAWMRRIIQKIFEGLDWVYTIQTAGLTKRVRTERCLRILAVTLSPVEATSYDLWREKPSDSTIIIKGFSKRQTRIKRLFAKGCWYKGVPSLLLTRVKLMTYSVFEWWQYSKESNPSIRSWHSRRECKYNETEINWKERSVWTEDNDKNYERNNKKREDRNK